MLQISGASKQYANQPIFSNFSLTVPMGQFTVLVGPSGCGKSTFFDGLTHARPLDSVSITWKGQALPHLGAHAAYLQQKDLLLPWLSLMDNALLPATSRGRMGRDGPQTMEMARQLFARMGLAGHGRCRPGEVSGGMRQRCALVRTLMFNRELILLDEPLSALDAITRRHLQSLLLLLQSEFDKTIVMITHDVEEALLLGDEVLVLGPCPMAVTKQLVPAAQKPRHFTDPELIRMKADVLAQLAGDMCHDAI